MRLFPQNIQDRVPLAVLEGHGGGVKCLHTHLAHYLFTGEDPVGVDSGET